LLIKKCHVVLRQGILVSYIMMYYGGQSTYNMMQKGGAGRGSEGESERDREGGGRE
jgi:hypothetical protein